MPDAHALSDAAAQTRPALDAGGAFAIGLKPIPLERWFEHDEPGAGRRERKRTVMARAGELAWAALPNSHAGQLEAFQLVAEARGLIVLEPPGRGPLEAAALLVSDDLCLMERRAGGWTLTAASLCAPTFFSAVEVVGRPLASLHAPVPGFEAGLLARVTRIFDALRPGLVLERRNWTLSNDPAPFQPDATPARSRIDGIAPETAGASLFVRTERQTVRRLPRTGGVLFTIRVRNVSLNDLAGDPERLAAFARAWRGATPAFRAYKRLALFDALVEGWLSERQA